MSPRRRTRAVDPRVQTGEQLGMRLPADLVPHFEAVLPPPHEHAVEVRGTGRMVADLARRAVIGILVTIAAFAFFVLAVSLAWPGAAIFWIFVLFWIVALTFGRRPLRAVRAWRAVRHTPWRYYEAKLSPGTRGERIELCPTGGGETLHLRTYPDKRADELLKWTATYERVWFAGKDTGRGIIVPAGGGIPVPTRRIVLLTSRGMAPKFVRYGLSEGRMRRRRRAAERAAVRAQKSRDRARAMANRAAARRAERLRKHPPKPVKVSTKPVAAKPAKPVVVKPPKPPRQGRRSMSQFLPKDK